MGKLPDVYEITRLHELAVRAAVSYERCTPGTVTKKAKMKALDRAEMRFAEAVQRVLITAKGR